MSIVIRGNKIETTSFKSCSYLDTDQSPHPARITNSNPRTRALRAIIVHTTDGESKSGAVISGAHASPDTSAWAEASYQVGPSSKVSFDYVIGRDGQVLCQNDSSQLYSWQAGSWNPITLGIELQNDPKTSSAPYALYSAQLTAFVFLIDELTRQLGIQRQIAWVNNGPDLRLMQRADEAGPNKGVDMVGIFAHANNTSSRGPGDPGPAPFKALHAAGYEGFDFSVGQDLTVWKDRQKQLGMDPQDGIAGAATVAALLASGKPRGMWITRPGDP